MRPGIGNGESGIGTAPVPVAVSARRGHSICIALPMQGNAAPDAPHPLFRFPIPHSRFPAS